MAAPSTVAAAGFFTGTRAGVPIDEAVLRIVSATRGSLALDGQSIRVTANVAKRTFKGTSLALAIETRNVLRGTVGGDPLELSRAVLRPIPAAERTRSDPGPTGAMKAFLDTVPDYAAAVSDPRMFWTAFGPVLYRGRLDGSARVLCIASDPGPTECLPFVRRTLVGDSGQKVQGFLAKLGLTRSYVLVNAFAVALHPGKATAARALLEEDGPLRAFRHAFFDRLLAGGGIEAIVVLGDVARRAYEVWAAERPAAAAPRVVKLAHPAAVDRGGSGKDPFLAQWAKAVKALRKVVTPDPDGDPGGPGYGAYFTEPDYARIPRWDLPAAAPAYAGDDSWGRAARPRHNNCCERPRPDDQVSLVLTPPPGQGEPLRYSFRNGSLERATRGDGKVVPTDSSGIPL